MTITLTPVTSTIQVSTETTIVYSGTYSTKFIAPQSSSLNTKLSRRMDYGSYNLSNLNYLIVYIQASRTGQNIQLGFKNYNSYEFTYTPDIISVNTWQRVEIDISGVVNSNKNKILQFSVTIVNADADNTFYLDNLFAATDSAEDVSNINSSPLVVTTDSSVKYEGSYSLKCVAPNSVSLNKKLIYTPSSPINLSGYLCIIGRIRANRTGSNVKLSFGPDIYQEDGKTYVVLKRDISFTAGSTANVHVKVLGAGGAGGTPGAWSYGAPGGAGGKAEGDFILQFGTTYHIVVGGKGVVNSTSSANGGGGIASINGTDNRYGGGGGGYSGVFFNSVVQDNALLIAGGGGGGGSSRDGEGNTGGAGGGSVGDDGVSAYDSKTGYRGIGGTQSAAGVDASSDNANLSGNQGALKGGNPRTNCYGGAGGGGYWGGSAGGYSEANTMGGGGGGSGYFHPTLISNGVLTTGAGSSGGIGCNNGTDGIVILSYTTGDVPELDSLSPTPNISVADTWQTIQLNIDAFSTLYIDKIVLTVVNADADNTFYLDNFYATTTDSYNLSIAKANAYAVLTVPESLNIAKANAYAVLQNTTDQLKESAISKSVVYSVLGPPGDSNISKSVVYSVLSPLSGSNISKVVVYSVLAPPQLSKPFTFIF